MSKMRWRTISSCVSSYVSWIQEWSSEGYIKAMCQTRRWWCCQWWKSESRKKVKGITINVKIKIRWSDVYSIRLERIRIKPHMSYQSHMHYICYRLFPYFSFAQAFHFICIRRIGKMVVIEWRKCLNVIGWDRIKIGRRKLGRRGGWKS